MRRSDFVRYPADVPIPQSHALYDLDYLQVASEAFWYSDVPLKELVAISQLVDVYKPQALPIWENSPDSKLINAKLEWLSRYIDKAKVGVSSGQFTVDSPSVSIMISLHLVPTVCSLT